MWKGEELWTRDSAGGGLERERKAVRFGESSGREDEGEGHFSRGMRVYV